ncbi:AhpC/TSA family protein [Gracilimonas mengyeensis]|uniref:AhpC/TSA family protein n=2 Tax=Gracilimonas mengyeensis TaxID=1302730 RepID=A0A521ARM5_9BACT|nr:AhpC/TSA family protein [Gracilimonas mengyeensis]
MRIFKKTVLPLLALMIFSAMPLQAQKALSIGAKAPEINRSVEDISGRSLTLQGVAGSNGLLVIFSCNTCPWVAKWEDRYPVLHRIATANNVGMIALNPNERIRDRGESLEDMDKRAQKQDYNFYYALDKDHIIADAFGATRTPEVFLFDSNLNLVYHGAIDDNANDAQAVQERYAIDALNALIAGEQISKKETKSLGCTIKRN